MPDPWAVETGVAPGVSVSNWVKFRPLSGKSLTALSGITVPNSDDENCRSGDVAVTSMVSVVAPTLNITGWEIVWFTANSKGGTSVF